MKLNKILFILLFIFLIFNDQNKIPYNHKVNSINEYDTFNFESFRLFNVNTQNNIYKYTNNQSTANLKPNIDFDLENARELLAFSKSREVVVAIIDTGVDYMHPDLSNNMWINRKEIPNDYIDNDKNGYIDDEYGWDFYNNDSSVCHYKNSNNNIPSIIDNDNHGTHIAGIIEGVPYNNIGISRSTFNNKIKIMSLKVSGGPNDTACVSDIIKAIKYANCMGADVCNLSLGFSKNNESLNKVIKESKMLFVAAAGNSGTDDDINKIYPACLNSNNLISVTYISCDGHLTNQSNYGKSTIDIAVPSENVYSTIVGGYKIMGGSSMAAAYVTSIAALLYSTNDHLYATNIKDIILSNYKPIQSLNGYIKYPGIASAYSSVLSAKDLKKDCQSPKLELRTKYENKQKIIHAVAKDFGGSGIRVIKWLKGKKKLDQFQHGMSGNTVKNGIITIKDYGYYSIYVSDYAGNESLKIVEFKSDFMRRICFIFLLLIVLTVTSGGTYAAVKWLSSSHVVEQVGDKKLAEAFVKNGILQKYKQFDKKDLL